MAAWGYFFLLLIVVAIGGVGGYIGYAHYRARKQGLPPPALRDLNPFTKSRAGGDGSNYRAPAPAPDGIKDWIMDKWHSLLRERTAGGAYEGTAYGGGSAQGNYSEGGRRGFGPLDPTDEAWDARVEDGAGGYYEEQELGFQDPSHGAYGGAGYANVPLSGAGASVGEDARGRSQDRERDGPRLNPFGDGAEESNISLRSISPRPDAEPGNARAPSHQRGVSNLSAEESPTERRSMFKENV